MAAWNGQEFIDKIRPRLGNRTDVDDVILQAVNNSIERIASMRNWNALIRTYSGTASADSEYITLPTGCRNIISVWIERSDSVDVILEMVSNYRGDRINKSRSEAVPPFYTEGVAGSSGAAGEPRTCGRHGDTLWLNPIPSEDEVVFIRCYIKPNNDIAVGDQHDMGDSLNHVIAGFATAEMYAVLNQWGSSRYWEGQSTRLLTEQRYAEEQQLSKNIKGTVDGASNVI